MRRSYAGRQSMFDKGGIRMCGERLGLAACSQRVRFEGKASAYQGCLFVRFRRKTGCAMHALVSHALLKRKKPLLSGFSRRQRLLLWKTPARVGESISDNFMHRAKGAI